VATSTTEAEYATNFNENEYLEKDSDKFYSDCYFQLRPSTLPATRIFCDNSGATALTKNPDQMRKTKHIDIAYHFVRECVEAGELNVTYISTDDMVADDLTKALSTDKHQKHLIGMGMTDSA
jgi:hypothetical protein